MDPCFLLMVVMLILLIFPTLKSDMIYHCTIINRVCLSFVIIMLFMKFQSAQI